MKKKQLPKYVTIEGSCALILHEEDKEYYRPAGIWETKFRIKDGILYAHTPLHPQIHGKKLIECTEKFFKEDNRGYV